MSLLAAIDPGLRRSGVAVFDSGRLCWAGLILNPERVVRGPRAWAAMAAQIRDTLPEYLDVLVVEQPQEDGRTRQAYGDVLQLTGVVTMILSAFMGGAARVECPTPAQWKSSTPKAVMQARLRRDLPDYEWDPDHNVKDAVMLGRKYAK